MHTDDIKKIEGKVLGQRISHPEKYDPTILVAVPRKPNRDIYNISSPADIFIGIDTWHAFELSFLTNNGLPVAGVAKITYNCNTPNLVESKSLKLYLNSFNMTRLGNSAKEGIDIIKSTIVADLTKTVGGDVNIEIFISDDSTDIEYHNFQVIENQNNIDNIIFDAFEESPELLEILKKEESSEHLLMSNVLRSNCKITHQPDWGTVFIRYSGLKEVSQESLLKYLVSFRNENHFHEEVCEMIFKRLYDKLTPDDLMVTCVFTRRGGIDICPSRSTRKDWMFRNLTDCKVLTSKLLRQ